MGKLTAPRFVSGNQRGCTLPWIALAFACHCSLVDSSVGISGRIVATLWFHHTSMEGCSGCSLSLGSAGWRRCRTDWGTEEGVPAYRSPRAPAWCGKGLGLSLQHEVPANWVLGDQLPLLSLDCLATQLPFEGSPRWTAEFTEFSRLPGVVQHEQACVSPGVPCLCHLCSVCVLGEGLPLDLEQPSHLKFRALLCSLLCLGKVCASQAPEVTMARGQV